MAAVYWHAGCRECPPELYPVNFNVRFTTISHYQLQEFGSTTRSKRVSAQTFWSRHREAHLHACGTHPGFDLTAVCHNWFDLSEQMYTFDGVWHFGKVFSSQKNPSLHCNGEMADSVYGFMSVSSLLISALWKGCPKVVVGLCMHNLRTTNPAEYYWWQFYTEMAVMGSWRPLSCHLSTANRRMLKHKNAQPHAARICTHSRQMVVTPETDSLTHFCEHPKAHLCNNHAVKSAS